MRWKFSSVSIATVVCPKLPIQSDLVLSLPKNVQVVFASERVRKNINWSKKNFQKKNFHCRVFHIDTHCTAISWQLFSIFLNTFIHFINFVFCYFQFVFINISSIRSIVNINQLHKITRVYVCMYKLICMSQSHHLIEPTNTRLLKLSILLKINLRYIVDITSSVFNGARE